MTGKPWLQWMASVAQVQRYAIDVDEWVTVEAGRVLVCDLYPVLIVDGVLRLDGAVRC